jgi:hypothetical protein
MPRTHREILVCTKFSTVPTTAVHVPLEVPVPTMDGSAQIARRGRIENARSSPFHKFAVGEPTETIAE